MKRTTSPQIIRLRRAAGTAGAFTYGSALGAARPLRGTPAPMATKPKRARFASVRTALIKQAARKRSF
ncbi:MAG: hypothetical protein M0038_06700 [Pseudomonadota bacterium]|nr:hypothetical protein [Pseudomonadota bacterium]